MEEEVFDIIQKIQEARSPKYFLWQIIKDVEWFASEKYVDWMIGKKDDVVYFNYDLKKYILYYDYIKIYSVLVTKYHLNELKTNELVGGMVSEYFKLRMDATSFWVKPDYIKVSEHLKLRVDTTEPIQFPCLQ